MNTFFAYSVGPQDQEIAILLSHALRSNGFDVVSSTDRNNHTLSPVAFHGINRCSLLIGVIAGSGENQGFVELAWNYACENGMPALLLVENGVSLSNTVVLNENVVSYNPHYPMETYKYVDDKLAAHRSNIKMATSKKALGWVLGGAAVLAFLSAISDE